MPWYHHIAAFLHHNLPQMRATRRANLAMLTAAILNRRAPSPSPNQRRLGMPQIHHQLGAKAPPDARHLPPGRPQGPATHYV